MKIFSRLQYRVWLYFAIFAIAILSVLALMQMVAFDYLYYKEETENIEQLGEMVAWRWRNVRFTQAASVKFYQAEIPVRIFNAAGVKDSDGVLQVSDSDPLDEEWFIRKYEAAGGETYVERITDTQTPNSVFLIYGRKIVNPGHPESSLYIYIVDSLGSMSTIRSILRQQFIVIGLALVVFAMIISYFISSRLAGPVITLTEAARQLAGGDYQVTFPDSGLKEVSQLAEALNYATQELKKNAAMKTDLLANVSHDLRTPLTMIKAYAEMIRDLSGDNPEKRREHVDVIIREADWMSAMISDILECSRIQAGSVQYEKTFFDLGMLTRECVRRYRETAGEEGMELVLESSGNCLIYGDNGRIRRVVNNLISNAASHSPADSLTEIRVLGGGESVRWEIRDHGSGIAEENLDRIWDQYFTQGNASSRQNGGTGLGLSIVRGIIEGHGGRYGVESCLGEGTMFWFELGREQT